MTQPTYEQQIEHILKMSSTITREGAIRLLKSMEKNDRT